MSTSSKFPLVILLLLAFAAGFAVDRWQQSRHNAVAENVIADKAAALDAVTDPVRARVTYVCPMHAHIHSDQPGDTCPICGMDLVRAEAPEEGAAADEGALPAVQISPAVVHNLGVRTARVTRGKLARRIDTMGMVSKIISTRNVDVKPGIPGRLEWLLEKETGDVIQQGDLLYTVFSPERIRAQEEYLQAWDAKDHALLPKLWDALRGFHFTDVEIKQLEETREIDRLYELYAPQTGALIQRSGRPGDRVNPVSRVYTIGGHYKVDVNAEVFEKHWAWLDFKQRAVISLPSVPGGTFEGVVERVNNAINFKTRSLTARLSFRTLNPMVKEGMVADISIYALPRDNVLYVPRDAVIRTGDEERVVVDFGKGRYRPVVVRTGTESGDSVEIVEGLQEGQDVVVSGQFLIDSESSLSASFRRMDSED